MKQIQLIHIAEVLFGIPRIESSGAGEDLPFLQLSDVDAFGRINAGGIKSMITMALDQEKQQGVPSPGDVLLSSKGSRNVAVFYHQQYPKLAVSNAFYIIRITDVITILPEFLAYYLNLPGTQKLLQSRVGQATTVPTLNKKDLMDFPVPVPSLELQQQLIHLYQSFLDIYDLSSQQLKLQQELVYQCFSTTLQLHR